MKNEIILSAGKWMEVEIIMLGKRSLTKTNIVCSHMWNLDLKKKKE
jgi:hypothetical protein